MWPDASINILRAIRGYRPASTAPIRLSNGPNTRTENAKPHRPWQGPVAAEKDRIVLRSVDDVVHRQGAHVPFTRLWIMPGCSEHMPVRVIQLRVVGAIIVTRPSGLLAKQRMPGHRLRSPDPVMEFSGLLELVQVLGPEMLEVLLEHGEKLQSPVEHGF